MTEDDEQDAALRAVAAGDLRALERLYSDLRVSVFAVALAVVRDRATAEDVLHDTFVRVCEHAGSYRPGTRPRAWVLTIARNLAIDAVRRRAREASLGGAHAGAAEAGLAPQIWTDALMTLEQVERELVVLHAVAGLTHAEIAERLGLPPGTVRWKYRVALERLAPLVTDD